MGAKCNRSDELGTQSQQAEASRNHVAYPRIRTILERPTEAALEGSASRPGLADVAAPQGACQGLTEPFSLRHRCALATQKMNFPTPAVPLT